MGFFRMADRPGSGLEIYDAAGYGSGVNGWVRRIAWFTWVHLALNVDIESGAVWGQRARGWPRLHYKYPGLFGAIGSWGIFLYMTIPSF